MKSKLSIIIVVLVIVCIILLLVAGTRSLENNEVIDLTQQSFSYKDKKRGGCYVAFQCLPHLYNQEPVKVVTKPFSLTYRKNTNLLRGTGNLYLLVTKKLYTTEQDVTDMLRFAANGNQLFLATTTPDSILQSRLSVKVDTLDHGFIAPTSVEHYVNPHLAPDTVFSRGGIAAGRYFTSYDTSVTTILGTGRIKDSTGRRMPNFIRITYGRGAVFLLLNPSSLTNVFLLEKHNIASLEKQLAYTYNNPNAVYWDEYYKYLNGPRGDFSEWQVLMRYPAMRWALWLVLALLLLYVLFEGKRRQRIIPDKEVLTNNSLEFVETLGQLYYQQGNNRNLAQKMVLHWTEYVRSRFYLNTSYLNQAFIDTLARKSGMPVAAVRDIVDSIHHIQLEDHISDAYLEQFYKNIHQFYLNTK